MPHAWIATAKKIVVCILDQVMFSKQCWTILHLGAAGVGKRV